MRVVRELWIHVITIVELRPRRYNIDVVGAEFDTTG